MNQLSRTDMIYHNEMLKMFFMLRQLILLSVVAFVLHLFWESAHVSLYGGFEHITTMPITFYASLGDVLYTLGAVLMIALFKGRADWFTELHWNDLTGLALVGFCIALFVEYKALAFDSWFYLDAMPIIPIFEVGLSPIVQMTILLPLSVWVASRLARGIFVR
jgi:hypothetical protein